MKGLLTIVTITRNDAEGLRTTIASADRIRQRGVEHIVVDGSDPQIASINVETCNASSGVTYMMQSARGISAAFNEGIARAGGKWIWCVNGGDQVHDQLDYDFFFKCLEHSGAEGVIFEIDCRTHITSRPPLDLLWPPMINWIPHPGALIRKDVLLRFPFDPEYRVAMDADVWMRMMYARVKFDLVSYPIATFEPGGISSQGANSAVEILRLSRTFRWKILKRWLTHLWIILTSWKSFRDQVRQKLNRDGQQ